MLIYSLTMIVKVVLKSETLDCEMYTESEYMRTVQVVVLILYMYIGVAAVLIHNQKY